MRLDQFHSRAGASAPVQAFDATASCAFLAYEGQIIGELRASWKAPLDPFLLMDHFSDQWRVFWRSKESEECFFGLGSVAVLNRLPQYDAMEQNLAGRRFFGGIPFDNHSPADWGAFAQPLFILPQWEWRISSEGVELTWRCRCDELTAESELAQLFQQALRDLKQQWPQEAFAYGAMTCTAIENKPSANHWRTIVDQAKARMQEGALKKVVLSRTKYLSFSNQIPVGHLLRQLQELREESFLFAWLTPQGEAFLGRSPERLLAWEETLLKVDAIAGTRRRNIPARELQDSEKEKSEHGYVADYVSELLAKFCDSFAATEKASLLQLHHVQHMITRFEGALKNGADPLRLLHELHPTPAVGGTPRNMALSFLDEWEPISRGWFAGPVGWLDGIGGDFAIGIRSAFVKERDVRLYAGAGIVPDSVAEDEWLETEAKMQNFLNVFGVASDRP